MLNEILYGAEARKSIKAGVDKVANAVKVTLGPAGRTVVISHAYPSPNGMLYPNVHVTKDGVTVAKSVNLIGLERVGAAMIKEAAQKTMDEVGDGTSTTVVLTQAIVEKGLELIEAGANPMELKKGIEAAVIQVVEQLGKLAIPVGGDIEKIRQVATVSANNDTAIGDLIAEAFEKIGSDGIITIEESATSETSVKVIDGYHFERGYLSPYFITNQAKGECVLENPNILLFDKKISKMNQFGKWMDEAITRPLLIICDDMDGEALAFLAMNTAKKAISVCVVKSPLFGEGKREAMEDLAALTGGDYISTEKGTSTEKMTVKSLGRAKKVIISKDSTVIVGGEGNTEDLLNDLKMTETEVTGVEKEAVQNRIAKLTGGVAVLYIGAATETEMKEKKDRADDAVRATKAAVSEGIVPGGGTAYARLALRPILYIAGAFGDGEKLIDKILLEPISQICKNAGVDGDEKLTAIAGYINEPNIGYNARTDKVEDLIAAGIIDPSKVIRCALQNAASAAIMILTSEAMIAECV